MATINLVLTNEVNEILDEKQRQKEKDEIGGSDGDHDAHDDLDETGVEQAAEGEDGEKAKEGDDDKKGAAGGGPPGENMNEEVVGGKKTLKGMA